MKKIYSRLMLIVLLTVLLFFFALTAQARPANTPFSNINMLQQQEVSGVVFDQNGLPFPGVTVAVKDKNRGTITDIDGNYSIAVEPEDILVFTFLGFKTVEESVSGRREINVQLEEYISSLGEVQINAGYYNTTRRESTGNISRVTAEEIELQPVISPLQALQGRMAGVEIEQTNGIAGLASSIKIRGRNSLRFEGDYPLFIVDGVPINSSPISSPGAFTSNAGIDPLNTLNMANIESIEVLKDADATAIYGSRGANGVVLITTKKGKYNTGKTLLETRFYTGFSEVSNRMELMNTAQYLAVRNEAFENDGVTPTVFNAPDLVLWDQNRYTDWQDVLFGGTAPVTDVNVSISDGNENTSFLLGGSYHKTGAVFPGDFGYNKITGNMNFNHNSRDQKFKMIFSVNYGLDKNNLFFGSNYVNLALTLPPNAPALYTEDGSLNWENGSWTNPLASLFQPQNIQTFNLLSNLNVSYEFLPNLIFKTNLGYSNLNSEETTRNLRHSYNPSTWDWVSLTSYHSHIKRKTWIIEPQILYSRSLNKLGIDALLGSTFQQNENGFVFSEGTGYSDDHFVGNLGAADAVYVSQHEDINYKYAAIFSRLGLNWDRRYFLNLTGRRDGSSRFGRERRFAEFWALGGAWIFSEEPFFKNSSSILSFGKLRGSYGTTGSDQIPDYGFMDTYEATPGPGGIYPTQLTNPQYSWEVNKKLEAALQLAFINDRINLEVSWYRNRSSNQIVGYPLPAITGFTSVQANLPAIIENKGWELELATSNFQTSNFTWRTSVNATFPSNKLLEFNDLDLTPYRETYKVGHPLNITFLYKYDGINPETGRYQIKDLNNDGRFDINDRTVNRVGRKFYAGLNNNIKIGNFDISVLLEYINQDKRTFLADMTNSPGRFGNNSIETLNAWTQVGDNTNIQKLSQSIPSLLSYYNALSSNLVIGDASFLRFKTVTLNFQLPQSILKTLGISNLNIFLHGQNLFTFTNYEGLDPQGGKVVPPLRTITSGMHINF